MGNFDQLFISPSIGSDESVGGYAFLPKYRPASESARPMHYRG